MDDTNVINLQQVRQRRLKLARLIPEPRPLTPFEEWRLEDHPTFLGGPGEPQQGPPAA